MNISTKKLWNYFEFVFNQLSLKFGENEGAGFRKFKIDRKLLKSRESLILSKYFLKEKEAKIKLSKWIKKESDHEFYIRRSAVLCKYLLNIFKGQKKTAKSIMDKIASNWIKINDTK